MCPGDHVRLVSPLSGTSNRLDVFLAHRTALVDYATPIVGCRAQAEDLVQEAYLRFSSVEQGPASIGKPVGYLYRIVRNLALDWKRHLRIEGGRPVAIVFEDIAADTLSPEHEVSYRQQLRLVAAALNEVPDRARIAFEMCRLGGHTFAEIAAHLDISVGLVHQLVRDVTAHCAQRLIEQKS